LSESASSPTFVTATLIVFDSSSAHFSVGSAEKLQRLVLSIATSAPVMAVGLIRQFGAISIIDREYSMHVNIQELSI
jgi:hypothetical protein